MPAHRSSPLSFFTLGVVLLLPLSSFGAAEPSKAAPPAGATSRASAKGRVVTNYGRLHLSFEANRGQMDSTVRFLARGQGYTLFLRKGEAVLALHGRTPANATESSQTDSKSRPAESSGETENSLVRLQLIGANPSAILHAEDLQIAKTNYFLGSDPSKWRTDVPNYGRVRETSIYPGIDLVYHGDPSRMEQDFVVAPGANPERIRLAFAGARQTHIDPSSGELIVSNGETELRLLKPSTYQESNGRRTPVPSAYRMLTANQIGFTVGSFNRALPLVIDPVLVYSTYLGGSGSNGHGDQGNGIAVDQAGDAYIVGTTHSTDFPITSDAFESQNLPALAGTGGTVFVSELNPAGTELIYSTYLGGSGGDYGFGISIDSSNNIYLAGTTYSRDFPVTCGAFQAQNPSKTPGASVGFVTKLSSTGDSLLYSTYLGGSGSQNGAGQPNGDAVQAIALDANGDAYLTGYASSPDFPGGGAGGQELFAAELNPTGAGLIYSTVFLVNGSYGSFGDTIAVDSAGDAYVGSSGDGGVLTKVSPQGKVAYSLSIGFSVRAIAIDSNGNLYVTGVNVGAFPVTQGVLEGPNSGFPEVLQNSFMSVAYVTSLNSEGLTIWATYLEGINTTPNAIAVDIAGNTYIAGTASTSNYGAFGGFQPTPDALSGPPAGANSAFLVKLSAGASVLNYATLLGGSNSDSAMALALDGKGNVYLTGSAVSPDFPITTGAFQTTNNDSGQGNAFVSEFALAGEENQTSYPTGPNYQPMSIDVSVSVDGSCGNGSKTANYSWDITIPNGAPVPTGDVNILWIDNDMTCLNYYFDASDMDDSKSITCSCYADEYEDYGVLYTGDVNYQPSETPGEVNLSCQYNGSGNERKPTVLHIPLQRRSQAQNMKLSDLQRDQAALHRNLSGPKFVLPPAKLSAGSQVAPRVQDQSNPGCIAGSGPLLTVTASSVTRTYGQLNPKLTYTITGLKNGDQVSVAISTSATAKSSVGTYPIVPNVSGAAASKYSVMAIAGALTVMPANLTVTVSPSTATRLYGDPNPTFTFKETGLVNGDTISISDPANESSPVGTYEVTVIGQELSNYNLTVHNAVLAVTPAPLTVTVSPSAASREYGAPNPAFTFTSQGLRNHDALSIVNPATVGSPVGTYSVTVTGPEISNYNLTLRSATLTVTPAPLTLTILPAKASRFYGYPNPTFACQAAGLRNGDTAAAVNPTYAMTKPGSFKIGAAVRPTAGNYTITLHTAILTIEPAPLTVTMEPVVRPYGSPNFPNAFSFSGRFPASGFYLNGTARPATEWLNLVSGQCYAAGTAYFKTPARVGSFDTVFTIRFPRIALATGMTFVLQNQGPTSLGGGGIDALGYGYSPGSKRITPSAAIKLELSANAGVNTELTELYTDGVTVASPDFPGIDMASAGVQLESGRVFQIELSYDGKNLLEVVTDTQTGAIFHHVYSPVNLPAILDGNRAYAGFTASACGQYGNEKTTADVLSWSYSDSPVPYSITGLVNGEYVTVVPETTATNESHVGTYSLTATVSGKNLPNYTLTIVNSSLTVGPAPLTVKATDLTIKQGQPAPPLTYNLTGFVLGENKSVVRGAPILSTTATSSSPAGTYPIVVKRGNLAARDYSFVLVDGTVTVQ